MKILYESMEHNANLKVTQSVNVPHILSRRPLMTMFRRQVTVQEGKNMKKLEGNRFVTPRCVIKTQRGQEYHTPPVRAAAHKSLCAQGQGECFTEVWCRS